MKLNPFPNSLEKAARTLVQDFELRTIYKDLTNGRAGYDPKTNTILLPVVNFSTLTPEQSLKLSALTYHELRHHAVTDCELFLSLMENQPRIATAVNYLEDARIEICPAYTLTGAKEDLNILRAQDVIDTQIQADTESMDNINRFSFLLFCYKIMLPGYGQIKIPAELKEYFNAGWEILQDGRFEKAAQQEQDGTRMMQTLIEEIFEKWQIVRDEEIKQKGDKKDGNATDLPNESGDSQESSKENTSQEPNSDSDSEEQSSASSKQRDDSKNGKSKKKNKGTRKESEKKEQVELAPDGKPKKVWDEFSQDPGKFDAEKLNIEVALYTQQQEEGNAFEQKRENSEPNFSGNPYIPYGPEDREVIPVDCPEEFLKIEQKIQTHVQTLRKDLSIIIRQISQSKIERNLKRGKIDQHALAKIALGSKLVKKKTFEGKQIGSAVSLIIDLSGSMQGKKAELAVQIATLFGEALQPIPEIPFEVRGFNTSPIQDFHRAKLPKKGAMIRNEKINHFLFKRFTEQWAQVRFRMGTCAKTLNDLNPELGTTGGCNIDHEALILAAHHLMNRKEKNKIMIVICDGIPSGFNGTYQGVLIRELISTIDKIRKSKIKLFCFGIECQQVKEFYEPDVDVIYNLNDLNEKAIRKLAEFLIKN